MRLARLVAAGLALGVVVGFVTALVRPRGPRPVPVHRPQDDGTETLPDHQDIAARSSGQVRSAGAGADLSTRPIPLPMPSALSGTGGSR